MKTKTIITAVIVLFSLTSFAQTKKELTKEETLAYINKTTYNIDPSRVVILYELDNKVLVFDNTRVNLMDNKTTAVVYNNVYQLYAINFGDKEISWRAKLEEDAQRLKRAFDHLIKLVRAEPDTDPFAN